ncbi:unnamed protein product [Prunus armeniaca]|uniref:Uncharacterized protein n=1 Tax=Prunus armeniaca TaxID=36596 RepID=A0A6J5U4X5_PRUAR|nr:unnamed protein product [Prunus armeniaca]
MKCGEDRWQLGEILESKHQDASDKECTPRRTDDDNMLMMRGCFHLRKYPNCPLRPSFGI